jgi:hypothetical protein
MKSIIITVLSCATAVICTILLRADRVSTQPRYRLFSFDETAAGNGKTVKSVYRIDTLTGKAWRISSSPVDVGAYDAQKNPVMAWADGWEEIAESRELAIAKVQAEWKRP